MRRVPHENVATVLVDPHVLEDFELQLMMLDLRVWPVRTAPIYTDGARMAFQIRHRLLTHHRGEWDLAATWVPVWIGFGARWQRGDEPLRIVDRGSWIVDRARSDDDEQAVVSPLNQFDRAGSKRFDGCQSARLGGEARR